jgi:hypothetical protein
MNRFILLCLSFVCVLQFGHPSSLAQDDSAGNAELDKAMRQYIRAIVEGDTRLFLSLVPRTKPFEFVIYEIGTLKKEESTQLTLQRLAADFKAKGDTYSNFFGDVDEGPYIYRLTVIQTPFEKWRKEGTTFNAPLKDGKSYVRWRQEDGRWVLDEVGDTYP